MKKLSGFFLMVIFIGLCSANASDFLQPNKGLRPISTYISGSAFRSISNFTYEESHIESWRQKSSKRFLQLQRDNIFQNIIHGDIVFVQIHLLDDFILRVHPQIACGYILITHNGDETVGSKYTKLLDDPKIIKWFAQNVSIKHKKLTPIPIGIENRYWYLRRTSDLNLLSKITALKIPRKNAAYVNILVRTFQTERAFVDSFFKKKSFSRYGKRKDFSGYLKDLKRNRFCVSPSGNGIDCHRTWESLLMGCIPIVRPLSKSTDEKALGNEFLYKDLPVIMVDDWTEVTEEFLDQKFLKISQAKLNLSKLYFPYWKALILQETEKAKAAH